MNTVVAVVGLGYVGLPLAAAFGRLGRTIGYDLSEKKVNAYRQHVDPSGEVTSDILKTATYLDCTTDPTRLYEADNIIVAVPTPVNAAHQPDLTPLIKASETVGRHMKQGATIIYESTVYPGATEEVCIPILERYSGLKWKTDFHVGYSPERINPGDKQRPLTKIVKIVSGDDEATLDHVERLYARVIEAGVYRAGSIKIAEAAKVIENTQRDLNIALMNELAIILNKLNIDTLDTLEAAGTKWNFMPFRPGIVGGHCIGVDPYYLTYKSETIGYYPQVILSGRRINDGMGKYIAEQTVKRMIEQGASIRGSSVNVLGITFKENCPDWRNTRVVDIVSELQSYKIDVYVHDPLADAESVQQAYGIQLTTWDNLPVADAVIAAVAHQTYRDMPLEMLLAKLRPGGVFSDIKSVYDRKIILDCGFALWRL